MYEIKIVTHMAAAHQLRGYEGGCEKLHGHNWKIEVYVTGKNLAQNGLLVDFKRVKEATAGLLAELDHSFLNDLKPFSRINPSSENIARYIYDSLSRNLNDGTVTVSKVTAWESDTACATYMEP
ncbi:MAG: 6-carboxytetrahydropterin synthase QueD [Desulfatiglandales bacterium]